MINITSQKAHGDYDYGTSKLFGSPTMPEEWLADGTVGDDDFFFCQLKIAEFKKYDTDKLLPESGFIYIFLTENNGEYIPNVRFCPSEPDTLIDDFNLGFDFIDSPDDEYSLDFYCADDNSVDGSALLVSENNSVTLLRYDPLDDNMPPFLAETEKIAYFDIAESELLKLDFSKVTLTIK